MPREDTQFKSRGVRTTHDQQPISVKFPKEADAVLRDKGRIPDRSAYIRESVLNRLQEDGLVEIDLGQGTANVAAQEAIRRVEAAIAAVLPTIPIKDRNQAHKWFKKLVAQLEEK